MQTHTQVDAARTTGERPASLRSAKNRGTLQILPGTQDSPLISAWELERYRHRRDKSFTMSLHPLELPPSETPVELCMSTTPAPSQQLAPDAREALVRFFSLPPGHRAVGIVVIGDLQRTTYHGPAHRRMDIIEATLPRVRDVFGADTRATDVIWAFLPGWVSSYKDGGSTDVMIVALATGKKEPLHIADSDYSSLSVLESRLGQKVLTWPAVHPLDDDQVRQWDLARSGRLPRGIWTIDPYRGAATMSALRRLHGAAAGHADRQAVVSMISRRIVRPQLTAATRPGPYQFPDGVTARLAVQVLAWRPEPADTSLVDDLAEGYLDEEDRPAVLPGVFQDAVTWLRSIDRYSPIPDLGIAEALTHFLESLAEAYPVPKYEPLRYSVVDIGITGAVGTEWLAALSPAASPDAADNSEYARQFRALQQAVADDSRWARTYGPPVLDRTGVIAALATEAGRGAQANALVVRPDRFDHLQLSGTSAEGQDPTGGDLAIFLRLADGNVTVLPHTASGGVNWGYSGGGPTTAALDVAAAHAARYGLDELDEGFRRYADTLLNKQGLDSFTIKLDEHAPTTTASRQDHDNDR